MRRLQSLTLGLGLTLAGAAHANPAAPAKAAGGADEKIASLEVSIDDAGLLKKNAGIRTLYVIIYDAESAMPMPYGALQVKLDKDAKGSFYKGDLTTSNVMMMSGGPVPKSVRIKARLDKDGSAGKDDAGDLVGIVDKVKAGDKAKVVINTAI